MSFKNWFFVLALMAGILAPSLSADAPYTEGTVWNITFVRTEANRTDDYLTQLSGYYKKFMDKAKEDGLILSYKLLLGSAANEDDFDLMIMVESKNMASFDNSLEKWEAMEKELFSENETETAITNYTKVREILGSKLMREIFLK
jgi:hypothetical protein